MRYILGLAVYLLGAQLIGAYETTFLVTNHLDNLLFSIGPVAIRTSTLAFLATLVILLIVLARFDLIPRSLGAMMGQPTPSRKSGPAQSQKTQEGDWRRAYSERRFGVLLVIHVVLLAGPPVLLGFGLSAAWFDGLLALLLVAAILSLCFERHQRLFALLLGISPATRTLA